MTKNLRQSLILILTSVLISFNAIAGGEFKVQMPKTVSAFNHKIIHSSSPNFKTKANGKTEAQVYFIAKWGVHRFEYGVISFECKKTTCKPQGEPKRIAFYERCEGLSKSGKPLCDGLVSSSEGGSGYPDSEETRLACEEGLASCDRSNDIDGTNDSPFVPEEPLF